MNAPLNGPDPEDELSPAARARVDEAREISADNPGWVVTCDLWGQFWARRGDDVTGPVSCPAALRSMIGLAKPRKAAP